MKTLATLPVKMSEDTLWQHIRALPDEMISVIGSHMAPGDQAAARLVCRRWRQLMRQAFSHVAINPLHLHQRQQPQQQPQQQSGARALRPRAPPPDPPGRGQPPEQLLPLPDFRLLPTTFPSPKSISIRLLSRHGQRGEAINCNCTRVEQLFTALTAISKTHQSRCRAAEPAGPSSALLMQPSSSTTAKPPQGMHISLELDIDLPRKRHQAAHAAAIALLDTTWESLAKLGGGLTSLQLAWFDPAIVMLPSFSTCLERLSGSCLARLQLGLTPGTLLPSLSGLQGLTSLQFAVGEDMHMPDLGLPRHTEISVLSHLTRLSHLRLSGWVCEVSLAHALQQLPQLSSLAFGEDLGSLQGLPMAVLTRLTALTLPVSLPVNSDMCDAALQLQQQQQDFAHAQGEEGGQAAHSNSTAAPAPDTSSRSAQAPILSLPRLAVLCAPPPLACMHDGEAGHAAAGTGAAAQTASVNQHQQRQQQPAEQTGVQGQTHNQTTEQPGVQGQMHSQAEQSGVQGQGVGVQETHSPMPRGAARRRARWPQLVVPSLRRLNLDLGLQQRPVQDACNNVAGVGDAWTVPACDVGPSLKCVTQLQCRLQADPLAVSPLLATMAAGGVPHLQELELHVTRPSMLPPASLLCMHAKPLGRCVSTGLLRGLKALKLTAAWDGLIPEGYTDYMARGAYGGVRHTALQPSGMLPKQHLGFLGSAPLLLPSLTHLHLATDRFRIDLCPPSLTCLVLDGVVRLEPLGTQTSTTVKTTPAADNTNTAQHAQYSTGQETQQHSTGFEQGQQQQQQQQQQTQQLTAPPLLTPNLQRLTVVLACHPRVHVPLTTAAAQTTGQAVAVQPTGQPPVSLAPAAAGQAKPPLPQTPSAPSAFNQAAPAAPSNEAAPTAAPSTAAAATTGAPTVSTQSVQRASDYCVVEALLPLMGPRLSHLSFTVTPGPQVASRLECLSPASYGIEQLVALHCSESDSAVQGSSLPSSSSAHVQGINSNPSSSSTHSQGSRLRGLRSLNLYVMPRVAFLLDCAQLTGLSSLSSLRSLSLESPITGATRLVHLTQLSALTALTELVTGRLDNEAYTGRLPLGHISDTARHSALTWASSLVAQRFGALPTLQSPPAAAHRAPSPAVTRNAANAAVNASNTPAGPSSSVPQQTAAASTDGAAAVGNIPAANVLVNTGQAGGPSVSALLAAAVVEEGETVMQAGSDDDVHSDDLLWETGEETGEESAPGAVWEDED